VLELLALVRAKSFPYYFSRVARCERYDAREGEVRIELRVFGGNFGRSCEEMEYGAHAWELAQYREAIIVRVGALLAISARRAAVDHYGLACLDCKRHLAAEDILLAHFLLVILKARIVKAALPHGNYALILQQLSYALLIKRLRSVIRRMEPRGRVEPLRVREVAGSERSGAVAAYRYGRDALLFHARKHVAYILSELREVDMGMRVEVPRHS